MKKESDSHADCYQRLVKDMPIGFAHCKMIFKSGKPIDFIYLDVNKAYGKLTGLGNVIGKKVTELLPGVWQSNRELLELYGRVASSGTTEHFERYVERLKSWLNIFVHSPEKEHFVIMIENITERKQAEESLKKSEERFRLLFNSGKDAVAVSKIGKDGLPTNFTQINDAACETMGYTREEMLQRSFQDITAPDFKGLMPARMKKLLKDKQILFESVQVAKDGHRIPLEVSSVLFQMDDGPAIMSVARDVTERKAAEEALHKSEDRFRKIVEQAPMAMAVVGMDETIEFINRKAVTVFGYRHEDIPTMDRWWVQAYPDKAYRTEVVADWTGRVRKALTEGSEIVGNEYRVTCKDRAVKTMFISGAPVSDKIFVMFDDITELTQVAEALKESETRYRALVESSPDAITQTDLSGRILMCNRQTALMHGYERPEDLIGKSAFDLFPPDEHERARLNLQKTLMGKAVHNIEYRFVKKDGSQFHGELSATVITDAEGKPVSFMAITRDISERKRAEEALRESEERFSTAFKTSPYAYMIATMEDGRIIEVNDAFTTISGYTREEALAGTTLSLKLWVNKEDRQRMTTALRDGRAINGLETKLQGKNGNIKTVMLSAQVIQIGNRSCILSIIEDITERKQAEKALRNSESNYRTLMEQASDAIFISDKDGNYVDANVRASVVFGYSPEEILHLGMKDLLLPEEIAATPIRFKELRSGEPVLIERRMRRKDGSVVYTEISGNKLVDGRFQGIVRDITERKLAQEAVQHAQQEIMEALSFNKMILESSPVGMLVYKASGECVSANQAAARIIGGTTEQLLAQNFRSLGTWKRDGLLESADRALTGGKPVTQEIRSISSFGKTIWFNTSFAPFTASGENHLLFLIEDISERRKADEVRRALEDQLNQKQKLESLGVLAGGIAHDFNNLLTGIFGYIDLARSSSKDAKTAEYLEATLSAMNRARSLTLQLLTFAKGGFPLQKITPLTPFIEDTARFALSGSTISCKFSLPENLWPCNIDKDQIGQVIDNIVINAQQAMPNGGDIEITARNISFGEKEHPPLAKGDYVKVSIKDHGIGIPKDIIPRIFDPFYTTKTKGHGLGLATCYSIITRHEGCIEVESEQGKGSTFHVYLPASPESVVKETVATGRHKGSGTILVMDDEEVVRDTLRQMLESMGYTVVCRNDGEAAVDFYGGEMRAKRQCSGMIFDLTVAGGMGGIETVKKIRNLNKEIPIFVASGYTDDAVMKNPADYGFTASISKPFTLAELSEMLNKNMKH